MSHCIWSNKFWWHLWDIAFWSCLILIQILDPPWSTLPPYPRTFFGLRIFASGQSRLNFGQAFVNPTLQAEEPPLASKQNQPATPKHLIQHTSWASHPQALFHRPTVQLPECMTFLALRWSIINDVITLCLGQYPNLGSKVSIRWSFSKQNRFQLKWMLFLQKPSGSSWFLCFSFCSWSPFLGSWSNLQRHTLSCLRFAAARQRIKGWVFPSEPTSLACHANQGLEQNRGKMAQDVS